MNILLTGGTGYIGSHTAVSLVEAGHKVVLYDNFANSSPSVRDNIEAITGQSIPLVSGDILDTANLTHALQDHQIEAVIHFAGLKAVGESIEQPMRYYANNVEGSISLIEAMQKTNIRTLVFSSSATIYGPPHYLPFDEQHPKAPTNPYGQTKLVIEQMLADLCASDATWRVACLRYFNPAGAHPSAFIGETTSGTPNNLVPYLTQVAVGKRPFLRIFGNDYDTPDGTGVRDYIHVMDLAEGHLSALNFLAKTPGWQAFNLGTGVGISVLELIETFESVCGIKIPYQFTERRAGDIATSYACANSAGKNLHWHTSRTLTEICSSVWKREQALG